MERVKILRVRPWVRMGKATLGGSQTNLWWKALGPGSGWTLGANWIATGKGRMKGREGYMGKDLGDLMILRSAGELVSIKQLMARRGWVLAKPKALAHLWENRKIKQTPMLILAHGQFPIGDILAQFPGGEKTVLPGTVQASAEVPTACVTTACWLLGCWVQNADVSHLCPEGMSTGPLPPGSSQASLAGTHLQSWKLSAKEHVLFSAPRGMRWSWQAWPGCVD